MGCSKDNLQTDNELRVVHNTGVGMVWELTMAREFSPSVGWFVTSMTFSHVIYLEFI